MLGDSPFAEGIVLFNGTNTDERSRQIYTAWLERHQGTDRVTGSRTADMRSALVDYFREQGRIMIATEAGAEGINLQFCSLVVNYDLPWNPQRIEQRIGRCHRYGQKHDVVVVNFLNRNNAADLRVFQLLAEKFQLFEGVFGASDEVLGAIESGVDFEKRIAAIYQRCRKPEEIQSAFDQLQLELSFEINESMTRTRQQLLENFDDEVREKLKLRDEASKAYLNRFERLLMQLTRHELGGHAEFLGDSTFRLRSNPISDDAGGIDSDSTSCPAARAMRISTASTIRWPKRCWPRPRGATCQPPKSSSPTATTRARSPCWSPGRQGGLADVSLFSVESLDQAEDHLIVAAVTDDGQSLDEEVAARCSPCRDRSSLAVQRRRGDGRLAGRIVTQQRQATIQRGISERNARFFEAEADKLDGWADDLKVGLEREIKELDRQIKEARRAATTALTLEEKLAGQKQIKALEAQRNQKRRSLFDAQDEVDSQREELIARSRGS